MYRLILFGGIGLEGPSGPLSGRIVQRRQLALLSVLACVSGRALTREKVVGLLWGDSPEERARHLLSDTLYVIRQELGPTAVQSLADRLQLDPALVWSDVGAFEEAAGAGEWRAAIELYRGPFLDGFYIAGAAEFERWVEAERRRLAERYAEILERLAQAAEAASDWTAAVGCWRKRAAAEPTNSRVALRLIAATARAGDVAGAVQHARVHELLVREELGLEPPQEVGALVERIRRGAGPRVVASPEPRPVPAAASRHEAAPAPAAGPSAAAAAPRAARGARWMRPVRRAAPGLAALALLLGIGGARVVIDAAAPDRSDRQPGADPAAHRDYLKGRHLTWSSEPTQAIGHFKRAIAREPGYALAYAGLADLYGHLGVLGSMPPEDAASNARTAAEQALLLDPELPEAHTARAIVGFWFDWDWDAAGRAYTRARELGGTSHADHYVAYLIAMERVPEAVAEARRRLAADPLSPARNLALGWTYFMAGRHDEAIAQLQETSRLFPGFAWPHVELAWNYAFKGMSREAVDEARRAEELLGAGEEILGGNDFALASLAHVYAVAGRTADALRLRDELERRSEQAWMDPFKFAIVHAGLGESDEAFRWLDAAYDARSPQMVYLAPMSRNFFRTLAPDPRYRELRHRMRLGG